MWGLLFHELKINEEEVILRGKKPVRMLCVITKEFDGVLIIVTIPLRFFNFTSKYQFVSLPLKIACTPFVLCRKSVESYKRKAITGHLGHCHLSLLS